MKSGTEDAISSMNGTCFRFPYQKNKKKSRDYGYCIAIEHQSQKELSS